MRSPGTSAARRGGVPAHDDPAAEALADLTPWLRGNGQIVTSSARRARVQGSAVEPRLTPWDLGSWAGRQLGELPPRQLAAWRSDPAWNGHGGESLEAVHDRVRSLLDEWGIGQDGRRIAVTHASVVRAAVLIALRAPTEAAWDLDVRPGSGTELHRSPNGWRVLSVGCPL